MGVNMYTRNCFIAFYASKNIFILDDELIIRLDLEKRLKKIGYLNIFLFKNPEEAIAESDKTIPDLVITDEEMHSPMNGPDAVDYFKEKYNIPIIGISGLPVELWIHLSVKHQLDAFFYKPIREEDFFASITLLFHKYYGANDISNEKLPDA